MTEDNSTHSSSVVDEIHAAREAYKQELDHSYWELMKALYEGFHNEYAAFTVARKYHPRSDDSAYEWLYRFAQAEQVARSLVALIPLLCEMGMPIYHAQIEKLVTLYLFAMPFSTVPPSDPEFLTELLTFRLMDGTGEPIPRDVDDFSGDHLEFMAMGEQSSLSDRVVWNMQHPDGPGIRWDDQL